MFLKSPFAVYYKQWVSDCREVSNISDISWWEQVTIQKDDDDDDVRIVLDQHAHFDIFSASSLQQQSPDWHVAPHRHIVRIPNRSVCSLMNVDCLAKKQQTPISQSFIWIDWE
jgi:hypothetical protein